MSKKQKEAPELSIARCCGSCKYYEFSWGYEESFCNLYNMDVPMGCLCPMYEQEENIEIEPVSCGFVIGYKQERFVSRGFAE